MDEIQGRFLALLKQEEAALIDLHDILQQEMNALKSRNTDLVNELIESKNVLLNRIGMLDKQRQLFIENNHSSSLNNNYIDQINILNDKIKTSLDKCKHQNKINGGIIEMSMFFNQNILNIMRGSNQEATYSAKGKDNSQNAQHSIARV